MRYFVIWAPIGQVLVTKLLATALSTCQLNISRHVSQLSVDVSVHQSGEGQLSVNILADILADS